MPLHKDPIDRVRIVSPLARMALVVLFAMLSGPVHADVIILQGADLKPYRELITGFREGCGCDPKIRLLSGENVPDLAFLKPADIVLVVGTSAFKKAKNLKDIPVVYTMAGPSEVDRSSLGQNFSGVSMDIAPQLSIASMRALKPKIKTIGLLANAGLSSSFLKEASEAAASAGIELIVRRFADASKLSEALLGFPEKTDFLWMPPDPALARPEAIDLLLRYSFERRTPVFSFSRKYVEMGALASLDIDPYEIGWRAAELVKELSAGRSGPVRVYAPEPRFWINRKVAAKMEIVFGDDVLKRGEIVD